MRRASGEGRPSAILDHKRGAVGQPFYSRGRSEPRNPSKVRVSMDANKPYSDPSQVKAKDGAVAVHGPDEVDVDMTPEAAEETAERLTDEAVRARGQRRLMRFRHRPE